MPSFSVIEATVPFLFFFFVSWRNRVVFPAPEGPASRAARVPAAERRFLFGGRLARRKRAAVCFEGVQVFFRFVLFFEVREALPVAFSRRSSTAERIEINTASLTYHHQEQRDQQRAAGRHAPVVEDERRGGRGRGFRRSGSGDRWRWRRR